MRIAAITFIAAAVVLTAAPAHAYIDPGTGGMLTQLVTGGVAGIAVLLRLYWSRISEIFHRPSASPDRQSPTGTSGGA